MSIPTQAFTVQFQASILGLDHVIGNQMAPAKEMTENWIGIAARVVLRMTATARTILSAIHAK